jgi:transposase InsO family protein
MDGNGSLFGTVQGNTRTVLLKFSVDLPKKHGRGGQSANRFARIRTERRHNYVRKVAESTTACFITNDRPNVKGLIHHSDRGIQYCCTKYVNCLKEHKINISMTENSDPYENAIAERVNGILKTEWLYDMNLKKSSS